jgi:hypothetical protein
MFLSTNLIFRVGLFMKSDIYPYLVIWSNYLVAIRLTMGRTLFFFILILCIIKIEFMNDR